MIALRLAGHQTLARDLRKMLTHLQEADDATPILDITEADAIRRLTSRDLLVTTPLDQRELASLRGGVAPEDTPRWVVVGLTPDFSQAVDQIALGAEDYIPGNQHASAIARRALLGLQGSEGPSIDSRALETILALFDVEAPDQGSEWSRHLGRMAAVLGVDLIALLLPDEPIRSYCPSQVVEERLEELLVIPCPLAGRSHGRLLLGRTRTRAASLESMGLLATVVGRLLGQQMQRADLLRKVLGAKQEWEATVDAIQDPMVLLDRTGRIVRANMSFADLVGRPVREVVEQPVNELLGAPKAASWWQTALQPGPSRPTQTFPVEPQRIFEVHSLELSRGRDGVIVYLRDITEERRLASLVLQRERFAALGELADGVFHDLNNLAASLQPELACARRSIPSLKEAVEQNAGRHPLSPEVRDELSVLQESLEAASAATVRLEQLLSNLRQYTRLRQDTDRRSAGRQPIDLNMLLRALPVLFNARMRQKGAGLGMDLGDIPLVEGVASDLMRVFENLIKNALDALPDGGQIAIRTREQGTRIRVEVSDSGHGIPQDVVARVFERGFTTRHADGGTGLGLYICREVLLAHGGDLSVESEPGRGTTFVALLPVYGDDEVA